MHIKKILSLTLMPLVMQCAAAKNQHSVQPYGQCHIVPANLSKKNVYHLPVKQQSGVECGSHSAVNIASLQELIKNEQPINQKTIREQADKKSFFIHNELLDVEAIVFLLEAMGLPNDQIHFIQYDHTQRDIQAVPWVKYDKIADTYEPFMSDLSSLFDQLKSGITDKAFFIANTGGHWVAIVAHRTGNHIDLLYMDSCNGRLAPQSNAYRILDSLASKLG